MKTETINFRDFVKDEWQPEVQSDFEVMSKIFVSAGGTAAILLPNTVLASGVSGAFGNVHEAIMSGFDAGVVLVIIFAGAAWGLGHRSKAIEILIGVCCGYILARHAVDIRDFLKGI